MHELINQLDMNHLSEEETTDTEIDELNSDDFSKHLSDFLKETQIIFKIGEDLGDKISKVKEDISQIDLNSIEFNKKLIYLQQTGDKLNKLFNTKKCNHNKKRDTKGDKKSSSSALNELLNNNKSNHISEQSSVVNTNNFNNTEIDNHVANPVYDSNNLTNGNDEPMSDQQVDDEPMSPSIIQKTNKTPEKNSSPTNEKISAEQEAYKNLMSMMKDDNLNEPTIDNEKGNGNINDQPIITSDENKQEKTKNIENSLKPNETNKNKSRRRSLPVFQNCRISIKKLDLDNLDIKLSKQTSELIKSASYTNGTKTPMKNCIDDNKREDREIANLCNFDFVNKKSFKKDSPKSNKIKLRDRPRTSKSALESPGISSNDESDDDNDSTLNEKDFNFGIDLPEKNQEEDEGKKTLNDMMKEDNFVICSDNESVDSFFNESESSFKKSNKKKNKINLDSDSNSQNLENMEVESSAVKKRKPILEPGLRLNLNSSSSEYENDEDDQKSKSKKQKEKSDESNEIKKTASNEEIENDKNKEDRETENTNDSEEKEKDHQTMVLFEGDPNDVTLQNEDNLNLDENTNDDIVVSAKKKKSKALSSDDENDEEKKVDEEDKNSVKSFTSEDSIKIMKRKSKKFLLSDSDDDPKNSDHEDPILGTSEDENGSTKNGKSKKTKTKLPYLKGLFSCELEEKSENEDENKENEIIELDDESSKGTTDSDLGKSNQKRKRIRKINSESDSSEVSTTKKKRLNKKIKKEIDPDVIIEKSDSEEENSDDNKSENEDEDSPSKKTRHKLRNIIGDEKLNKETQDAIQAERERKKRIEEKRTLENETELLDKSIQEEKDLFLDFDVENKKPLVQVDPSIAKNLKPHQIEGIKFMWDSCFEKVEMIQKGNKGSGCLLAHCMGLGKTLQVITLVHTLLTNKDLTNTRRVLILVPVNVLTNWRREFNHWTNNCKNKITLYELPNEKGKDRDLVRARLGELERWFKKGGVFLIGYNIFARLVQGQSVKPKKLLADFEKCLLSPGADLVICDEGHMLKSDNTLLSKSVSKIETSRRIVLTGTPLQNNLVEYHCMVSFVKPKLLGTIKEFKNRFANPINNGQHKDSTEADVRYMKKRAHVLHNLLDSCVQRKDYAVIRDLLLPKKEYVLSVRLSDKQIELYRAYMTHRGINMNNLGKIGGAVLFQDFQELSRIWTHPWVLKLNEVRVIRQEERQAEKEFIVDEFSSDDSKQSSHDGFDKKSVASNDDGASNNAPSDDDDILELASIKPKYRRRTTPIDGGGINKNEQGENQEVNKPVERWWTSMVSEECESDITLGGKLVLLDQILKLCHERGDKLLVFSQSLLSLDIIEKFLEHLTITKKDCWRRDVDYYRMDGQTDIQKRKRHVENFNDPDNYRSRLFLISTKAGGIGINLVGANRCIIFDASWNPSYDTQSIFRIYRFGQKKNVYVYRFLAQGTMEEKIYQRQVIKQSLSQRVIDEHQLDRHFTSQELRELYSFEPDAYNDTAITFNIPEDDLLKSLLIDCRKWISKYHEHDSLLENKLNEGLSEEERKAAWEEYENEKRIRTDIMFNHNMLFNQNNAETINTPGFTSDLNLNDLIAYSNINSHLSNLDNNLSENFLQHLKNNNFASYIEKNNLQNQIINNQKQQLNNHILEQDFRNRYQQFRQQELNQQLSSINEHQQNSRITNTTPNQNRIQQNSSNKNPVNNLNNSGIKVPIQRSRQSNTTHNNNSPQNYNNNNKHNNNQYSSSRIPPRPPMPQQLNRPMSQNQYLESLISNGQQQQAPMPTVLYNNAGLTLQQQQELLMRNNMNFNSNMNSSQLLQQHNKQINQQTYLPLHAANNQRKYPSNNLNNNSNNSVNNIPNSGSTNQNSNQQASNSN